MRTVWIRSFLTMTFVGLTCGYALASATDVYIAQSQAGGADGTGCPNARAVTFFNTVGNWGAGTAQIGPGTTVHLCGTFNGGAGSTMLTTQASGTSGNPITILFETGTIMSAPYWGTNDGTNPTGGAITLAHSFITLDGGTNGIIKNTASGTGLTYSGAIAPITAGVVISSCSNTCEVKNLTIRDLYLKTPYSNDPLAFAGHGDKSYGVFTTFQSRSNILIHDNIMSDGADVVTLTYTTGSNYRVYNNTLSRSCAAIAIGDGSPGNTLNGLYVYNNDISQGYVWWDTADNCHINGMHLWAAHTGSNITNMHVYNNYVHGNMSGGCGVADCWSHVTSFIFLEGTGGGTITSPLVFNNLLVAANTEDGGSNGLLSCSTVCPNPSVYNNTLIGQVADGLVFNGATGITMKNNIISNFDHVLYATNATMTASDNNVYNAWVSGWTLGSSTYRTFADWRAQTWDASGTTNPPNLDANYKLNPDSPAIGLSANLTGIGVAALNLDKANIARPTSGAWDAGAYQNGPIPGPIPPTISGIIPPSGLTAIVQ